MPPVETSCEFVAPCTASQALAEDIGSHELLVGRETLGSVFELAETHHMRQDATDQLRELVRGSAIAAVLGKDFDHTSGLVAKRGAARTQTAVIPPEFSHA